MKNINYCRRRADAYECSAKSDKAIRSCDFYEPRYGPIHPQPECVFHTLRGECSSPEAKNWRCNRKVNRLVVPKAA